jgi:hypothetical protein
MARLMVLLGIVGLVGLAESGVARADFERQIAGRDNRVVPAPGRERVVAQRKVADFKRGYHTVTAVPELDPNAAPLALALLIGGAALIAERRRSRAC